MKWRLITALILVLLTVSSCSQPPTEIPPSPAPTPTPVPTPTPTPTPMPTPTLPPIPIPSVLTVGGSGKYLTIQEAINSAPTGATIQVAQGTYNENITVKTPKTLTLQGGWDAKFTSRSNDSSLTTIDGGGNNRVISIQADSDTAIGLTIDGFTIRGGIAERGAGISVDAPGVNSQISLTMKNNTIIGNKAIAQGGGICANASSVGSTISLVLVNNTITQNASNNRGGGISIRSAKGSIGATLTSNTITQNTANNEGGGIRVESAEGGGAIVILSKNVIAGNAVTHLMEGEGGWDGGAIAAFASRSGETTLLLGNNLITGNEAGFGGGVFGYAWGSDAVATITLMNNIIAGNKAQYGAGIFSCSGKTCPVSEPGGSITWVLTNNTVTGNTASKCVGGIQLASGSTFGDGGVMKLLSHNDIVWGNNDTCGVQQLVLGVEMGKSGVATAKASYSDIGLIDTYGGGTYTLDHVINEAPLFIDPPNRVFLLKDGSPCIDSGDPSSVFNDSQRPPAKGTERNDMGAYGGPSNGDWSEEAKR